MSTFLIFISIGFVCMCLDHLRFLPSPHLDLSKEQGSYAYLSFSFYTLCCSFSFCTHDVCMYICSAALSNLEGTFLLPLLRFPFFCSPFFQQTPANISNKPKPQIKIIINKSQNKKGAQTIMKISH